MVGAAGGGQGQWNGTRNVVLRVKSGRRSRLLRGGPG